MPVSERRKKATRQGMLGMRQDGILKAEVGFIEEVLRETSAYNISDA